MDLKWRMATLGSTMKSPAKTNNGTHLLISNKEDSLVRNRNKSEALVSEKKPNTNQLLNSIEKSKKSDQPAASLTPKFIETILKVVKSVKNKPCSPQL